MTPISDSCSCGHIRVGMEVTEHRNWNPDCQEHGVSSAWYNSEEQRDKRRIDNEKLRDLQRRAREARERSKNDI